MVWCPWNSLATSESDEWIDGGHGVLYPLSGAERYATCTCIIETSSEVWKFRGPSHPARRGLSSNASLKFFASDNFRLSPS